MAPGQSWTEASDYKSMIGIFQVRGERHAMIAGFGRPLEKKSPERVRLQIPPLSEHANVERWVVFGDQDRRRRREGWDGVPPPVWRARQHLESDLVHRVDQS